MNRSIRPLLPSQPQRRVRPALALLFTAAALLGCNAGTQESAHPLTADIQAFHAIHGDPDAIGTLDATAPPADLTQYRRPADPPSGSHAKPSI